MGNTYTNDGSTREWTTWLMNHQPIDVGRVHQGYYTGYNLPAEINQHYQEISDIPKSRKRNITKGNIYPIHAYLPMNIKPSNIHAAGSSAKPSDPWGK